MCPKFIIHESILSLKMRDMEARAEKLAENSVLVPSRDSSTSMTHPARKRYNDHQMLEWNKYL